MMVIAFVAVIPMLAAGCGKQSASSESDDGQPRSQSEEGASRAGDMVAEFVVVEERFILPGPPPTGGSQTRYFRGLLAEDGELMLLEAPGCPQNGTIIRRNFDHTGFLSSMTFFVSNTEFTIDVSYGWLAGTVRDEVHLASAGKTVYIVRSGQQATFTGQRRETSLTGFPGVPVYAASSARITE